MLQMQQIYLYGGTNAPPTSFITLPFVVLSERNVSHMMMLCDDMTQKSCVGDLGRSDPSDTLVRVQPCRLSTIDYYRIIRLN